MINPQHILPTFARLKFFYAKSPFLSDFYPFLQLRRVTNEDVGGAVEWRQMKLKISCGVPLLLKHLNVTVVDGARSVFAPTVVSSPDQKHFQKMLPRRS